MVNSSSSQKQQRYFSFLVMYTKSIMIRSYDAGFTVSVRQIQCQIQFSKPKHVEQKPSTPNSNDVLWKFQLKYLEITNNRNTNSKTRFKYNNIVRQSKFAQICPSLYCTCLLKFQFFIMVHMYTYIVKETHFFILTRI